MVQIEKYYLEILIFPITVNLMSEIIKNIGIKKVLFFVSSH